MKPNRMPTYFFIVFLALTWTKLALAQEFAASVDNTQIGQYQRFQTYFTFSGGDINKLKNFRPPSFEGFKILSGPNQSTSMQIINGQVTSSITYSYTVQSQDIGEFTIGEASITYEGKDLSTKPIEVRVVKGSGSVSQGNTSEGISSEELAKNVFIVASPNKRRVFKGEQIVVTYKLYTRLNISSPSIEKLPSYNGFWTEDLETPGNINFQVEMYEGQRYRAAEIKKVALFPTKTGELTISSFELNIPVLIKKQRTRRDIFDDFFNDPFFGRTETIDFTAKSNSVKIEVIPLPQDNIPDSFDGAVGNFDFSASIDKTEVETNESVTIKLKASGKGNIELLELPEIKVPPGFEKFDPKINESISRTGSISGVKEVEYLLVPRVPGIKEIAPIEFAYFNPETKRYITQSSPAFSLNVKKGEGTYESSVTGFSKEDIKLLSQDIRYIRTSDNKLRRKSDPELFGPLFWSAVLLPLIVFAAVIGVKRRRERLSGNFEMMKYRKAEKAARKRLKLAKAELNKKDYQKVYTEVSLALSGYLEDKLGIQKAEFTLDRAVNFLESAGINRDIVDELKAIMERCEYARFAPASNGESSAEEIYEKSVRIIINLENSISKKR